MKIIFLCRLYDPHVGGVEKHVKMLSRELVKKGHKITIITEQYKEDIPKTDSIEGVKVIRLPYSVIGSKTATWKWMWQNKKFFINSDLVHVHDVYWWYLPIRIIKSNIPSYTTFHGYEGVDPPTKSAIIQRKIIEKLSDGSICVGAFMEKWYRAKSTKILYGAAKTTKYPKVKKKTAVYLGRLSVDAGIMIYLKAIALQKSEMFLDVYGGGDQFDEAKKFVLTENLPVAFHGWREDVRNVFKDARYAFCSRYLAIVEAMQSQRLVVAVYNNQIKRDYLECHPMKENMIIAGNFTELSEKLNNLNDEDENEMVEKAFEWARKQTWTKMANEHLDLWDI